MYQSSCAFPSSVSVSLLTQLYNEKLLRCLAQGPKIGLTVPICRVAKVRHVGCTNTIKECGSDHRNFQVLTVSDRSMRVPEAADRTTRPERRLERPRTAGGTSD